MEILFQRLKRRKENSIVSPVVFLFVAATPAFVVEKYIPYIVTKEWYTYGKNANIAHRDACQRK